MRKIVLMLFWAVLCLGTACTDSDEVMPGVATPARVLFDASAYEIPGELHLQLSDSLIETLDGAATQGGLQAEAAWPGVVRLERVFPDAGEYEPRHRAAGLHRWYRAVLDTTWHATRAAVGLVHEPGVEQVQKVPRKQLCGTTFFNDPLLPQQWHFHNDGTRPSTGLPYGIFKAGMDVNVVPVWQHFTTGSRDVVVAMIDGGIDIQHEDLAPVVLTDRSFNFVEPFYGPTLYAETHGCHTAGIVAAVNNNGLGVSGMAGGHDGTGGVRLMSLQVFQDTLNTVTNETVRLEGSESEALVWAADHGAVIANNSWGAMVSDAEEAAKYAELFRKGSFNAPLKAAIDYFIAYAGTDVSGRQTGPMKGGVVFFSAGNDALNHSAYAEYEPVVAVAAFGPGGSRASYSNYGDWVDLAAPGGNNVNESRMEQMVLSCMSGSKYGWGCGTSMACPHAAGAAALLVSYFGGPGFTADDLRKRLIGGADAAAMGDMGDRPIGPKLDVYGAFLYNDTPQLRRTDTSTLRMRSHETVTVPFELTNPRNEEVLFTLEPGSDADSLVRTPSGGCELRISALRANPGTYTATITSGYDAVYCTSVSVTYTILENHAPVVTGYPESPQQLGVTQQLLLDLADYVTDADGETLSFVAESSDTSVVSLQLSGTKLTITACGYGRAEVTCTGADARGMQASTSLTLVTRDADRWAELYPSPVSRYLYLRTERLLTCSVDIFSTTGTHALSMPVCRVSPFYPQQIDLVSLAPGRYRVVVKSDTKTYEQYIVKL